MFARWPKARPMVPGYDYPLPDALARDVDAAGDEVKSWLHFGGPRHVRTPEGQRLYDQPIGSVIKPDLPHVPPGKFPWSTAPKLQPRPVPPAVGSLKPDANGLDTPVSAFGMTYRPDVAAHPLVAEAKAMSWDRVPTVDYALGGKLTATEERVRSGPIRKVLGGEPFRRGYDPQILRTDGGDVLIDGHHRVVMHAALEHKTIRAKVLDLRGGKSIQAALDQIEADRVEAERLREEQMVAQAGELAEKMVAQATASEPTVTPLIEGVVDAHGGYMEGLEHRLKTFESTKGKILRVARRKGIGAGSAAGQISDVLRYTAVIPTEDYSAGVKATLDALGKAGFRPTMTNNYWPKGDAYSGLNILLYGKGQDLEIQFHTPESTAAKEANHADYEISRDTERSLEERRAAWDRQVPKWDAVPQPPGWLDFGSLFIYDAPGKGSGRGRYVSRWEAQGLPEPPRPPRPAYRPIAKGDEADPDAADLFDPDLPDDEWAATWESGSYPWSKGSKR